MDPVKSLRDEPQVGMPDAYKIIDPARDDYDAQDELDACGGI